MKKRVLKNNDLFIYWLKFSGMNQAKWIGIGRNLE